MVSLLAIQHLGVGIRDALAPANSVAAHHDIQIGGGSPRHRDGVCTRFHCTTRQSCCKYEVVEVGQSQ